MYLSRSRQKVRLYLFVYQGENSIKTIVSTLFFNFFLITIVLYIISILNSRLYIIRDIASIFIVTGTRVIKTETIERINESDEGSMQNVGKLLKEPLEPPPPPPPHPPTLSKKNKQNCICVTLSLFKMKLKGSLCCILGKPTSFSGGLILWCISTSIVVQFFSQKWVHSELSYSHISLQNWCSFESTGILWMIF